MQQWGVLRPSITGGGGSEGLHKIILPICLGNYEASSEVGKRIRLVESESSDISISSILKLHPL